MEPGRDLDALVAERVIEKDIVWQHWCGEESPEPYFADATGCDEGGLVPPYSIDTAAAGEVVEKMHSEGYLMALITQPGPNGKITARFRKDPFRSPHKWFERWLRSIEEERLVPHAICVAALKARGVEIPE